MSVKTTNPELIQVIKLLQWKANQEEAPIWATVAKKLKKSKHNRVTVNLSRVNRYTTQDDIIVVPGKVLGSGLLDHRVNIAALSFSRGAKEKIERVGGRSLSIETLLNERPKGSAIKIIG